jgi:pyrroline-5-carboxylate reductase
MSQRQFEGRVGFIGCGAMAQALAGGLAKAGIAAERIAGSDPKAPSREAFAGASGGTALKSNAELVGRSDVVVLAVKPGLVPEVLAEIAREPGLDRPLWISLAAGVRIRKIESALAASAVRIIRSMPNTPAMVGAGATGLCANAHATESDWANAEALFGAVGLTWRAPEEASLDAVTGLSGSGPAYVFLFLEALEAAGVAVGLPRDAAARLSLQTVYGAAQLAREREEHPSELREKVTSPGGTTFAGLSSFEADGFRASVERAVRAATQRSVELSGGDDD